MAGDFVSKMWSVRIQGIDISMGNWIRFPIVISRKNSRYHNWFGWRLDSFSDEKLLLRGTVSSWLHACLKLISPVANPKSRCLIISIDPSFSNARSIILSLLVTSRKPVAKRSWNSACMSKRKSVCEIPPSWQGPEDQRSPSLASFWIPPRHS